MILCYMDASAWSKRYTGEIGWEALDVLLDEVALGGHTLLMSSAVSHEVQTMGHRVWLVASDKRLLRAATIEGLLCLDPEVSSPREIRQLLISE